MTKPVKHVAISFTIKNQALESIAPKLKEIKQRHENDGYNVRLIHGFLPRDLVIAKGFPTDLVDMLESIFPEQLNFFNMRDKMAETVKNLKAEVYIVGDMVDGVLEEFNLYKNLPNQSIHLVPIKQKH